GGGDYRQLRVYTLCDEAGGAGGDVRANRGRQIGAAQGLRHVVNNFRTWLVSVSARPARVSTTLIRVSNDSRVAGSTMLGRLISTLTRAVVAAARAASAAAA